MQSGLVFVVTSAEDTDKIEAQFRDRKVTIQLANIMPFAKWPNDLTKEEQKLKQKGLAFLTGRLKNKRVSITGIDEGNTIRGDLVLREGEPFTPGAPSTLGWFMVHFNCMLIEKGYSIYQKDPPNLFFPDPILGERKQGREKLYKEAEAYAIKHKNGIWKHEELSKRLMALSEPGKIKK